MGGDGNGRLLNQVHEYRSKRLTGSMWVRMNSGSAGATAPRDEGPILKHVGIDLSSGGDLTTPSLEFRSPMLAGRSIISTPPLIHAMWARLMEDILTDIAPYDIWEKEGLLDRHRWHHGFQERL